MATRSVVSVRHSESVVMRDLPPSRWPLSREGIRRCKTLARELSTFALTAIVTSEEEKARQTGWIVAQSLQIPLSTGKLLYEHDREEVPFLAKRTFQTAIRAFFAWPQTLVFGNETAEEALARFSRGVKAALEQFPSGNIAIVTHGTVLSLYVAQHTHWDAAQFWERLGQPAYVRIHFPSLVLAETAFAII